MAIEIRLLGDNEDELANAFFNDTYQTQRPIENFRWEFKNGPLGKAIYVVAVDTSSPSTKIVGIQCAIPLALYNAAGKKVITAKSEDTLVHPDYRGQKLFERMYALLFEECRKAGIKYIWGFTPALKAFERIGFEAPFRTSQAILVFHPIRAYKHLVNLNPANKLVDKLKILGLCWLSFVKGWKRAFISRSKLALNEIKWQDKSSVISKFYEHRPQYYFLHQSDAYLDWRITKNPFNNHYRNVQAGTPPSPMADIIVNVRRDVAYIEQLLFSAQLGMSQRLGVLKDTFNKLYNTGTPLVRVLCFKNNEETREQIELLKKFGCFYVEKGNYFVWKSLDDDSSISVENLVLSRLFTQGNL